MLTIYDAMVRLAQSFAMRYPLVDGQGNFGNIDGDNADAIRYAEARMTELAQLLLDGIDEDAIDFRPTYDGESDEPVCAGRLSRTCLQMVRKVSLLAWPLQFRHIIF